jgi:hypothetical protein
MPLISTPNKPLKMQLTENKRGRYRAIDHSKYSENYDKIFGKKDKEEKNEK